MIKNYTLRYLTLSYLTWYTVEYGKTYHILYTLKNNLQLKLKHSFLEEQLLLKSLSWHSHDKCNWIMTLN